MFFLLRAFFWLFVVFGALSGPHDKIFAMAIVKDLGLEAARLGQDAGQASLKLAAKQVQSQCTLNPSLCLDITGKIAGLANPSTKTVQPYLPTNQKRPRSASVDTLTPTDLVPTYKKPSRDKPVRELTANEKGLDVKRGG